MESLTGKKTRKRRASAGEKVDKKPKPFVAADSKEIIPSIFKKSIRRKVSTVHILKPEELETLKNIPCDTEAALLNLRASFPVGIFEGRLPPVFLYSQLSSLVHSRAVIDHQLKKLAHENKILTFSLFSSSNYLIVFYSDFVGLKREGFFQRFVTEVLGEGDKAVSLAETSGETKKFGAQDSTPTSVRRSIENSKIISKEALLKKWKFEEDEIRQLVNAGYLGVQEGGNYCVSLPAAGEFIRMYEKGKKAVGNAIKRAKFGEILQKELEQRPMKKVAPLGVSYHIFDLIGSGEATKIDTTSGPLLRIKRDLPT
ncbi:Serine/threonine-protein kinase 19 [Orchesella cincta]|uniref:Serine/threonine-protein kinase 19 n=1 Tax=Orchesella cincta TaxID=48709 RepID=A0A1D2MVR4_ORCCI|nr:Serine/threonine-protein kinase 19 [Orchesella cincta]